MILSSSFLPLRVFLFFARNMIEHSSQIRMLPMRWLRFPFSSWTPGFQHKANITIEPFPETQWAKER